MTSSMTAIFLDDAIAGSGLTQREIAQRAGLPHPNILSMMKTGEMKIPLERIPALAQACHVDECAFLLLALEEYHPALYEVLVDVLGVPLTFEEREVVGVMRVVGLGGELLIDDPIKEALEAVFKLARCD